MAFTDRSIADDDTIFHYVKLLTTIQKMHVVAITWIVPHRMVRPMRRRRAAAGRRDPGRAEVREPPNRGSAGHGHKS